MLNTHVLKITYFVLFLNLTSCNQPSQETHNSSLHFGTLIDITLYGVDNKTAERAFSKLDEDFAYMHSAWSPWEKGSLYRVNHLLTTGKKFSTGPSVLNLINSSKNISEKTNQLFNPAIGQLINLWQIHRHDEPNIRPPNDELIQALIKKNPTLDDIKIQGVKISSNNPAVSLNFGAFAKGYAIDLQMNTLKEMGIKNAIINTGGDLKAIGSHGKRPWRIAIQHPRKTTWIAKIETIGEESVFTSGDYERFYKYKGKRYHHILDPRTGYPANTSQSVTVLHTNSGLADAAATALFIAGPEQWLKIAKQLGVNKAMLIDKQGSVHITPEMKKRVIFNPKIETTLFVSSPL